MIRRVLSRRYQRRSESWGITETDWGRVRRNNYHLQRGDGPSLENIPASDEITL